MHEIRNAPEYVVKFAAYLVCSEHNKSAEFIRTEHLPFAPTAGMVICLRGSRELAVRSIAEQGDVSCPPDYHVGEVYWNGDDNAFTVEPPLPGAGVLAEGEYERFVRMLIDTASREGDGEYVRNELQGQFEHLIGLFFGHQGVQKYYRADVDTIGEFEKQYESLSNFRFMESTDADMDESLRQSGS